MTDLIQSLAKVSDLWLDSRHPLREETIQALQVSTSLSRRQIELALANCFEELTESKLQAFVTPAKAGVQYWMPASAGMTSSVFHILPANAFTAWVHGAVTTLLLEHRCLLKPSSREPVFARAWKKSLDLVDPVLAEQVQIVRWDEKMLRDASAVIAYGSDETLQKIRTQLPAGVPFAGFGHKLSVGIMFQEALEGNHWEELRERVARDAEPFRLQGCLSPQILYVEDAHFSRWPELAATLDVSPKIKPFTQWGEVLQELRKFAPYLSCIGYAGSLEREDFLQRELSEVGVSRICPLGEMQRPSLSWRNGGIFLPDLLNSIGSVREKDLRGIS